MTTRTLQREAARLFKRAAMSGYTKPPTLTPPKPAVPATPAVPAKPAVPATPAAPVLKTVNGMQFRPDQSNPEDFAGKGELGGHTWSAVRAPYMKTPAQIDAEQNMLTADTTPRHSWLDSANASVRGMTGAVAGTVGNLGGAVVQPITMAGEGLGILPKGTAEGVGDARVMFGDIARRGGRQMLMNSRDRSFDTAMNSEQVRQLHQGNAGTAYAMNDLNRGASLASAASLLMPQRIVGAANLPGGAAKMFQPGAFTSAGQAALEARNAAAAAKAVPAATQWAPTAAGKGQQIATAAGKELKEQIPGIARGMAEIGGDRISQYGLALQNQAVRDAGGTPNLPTNPVQSDMYGKFSPEQRQQLQSMTTLNAYNLDKLTGGDQPQAAADPGTDLASLIGLDQDPQVQAAIKGYALPPDQVTALNKSQDPQIQAAVGGYAQAPEPVATAPVSEPAATPPTAEPATPAAPYTQLPPKDAAEAIKQLPPEQQQEVVKDYVGSAAGRYAKSTMPDATPEQQQQELATKAARIAEGKPAPQDVEEGVTTLASEHGADISQPNVLTQIFDMWKSLQPQMQFGLAIGVPLALLGLATTFGGEGGLGAMLGLAGLGAIGAGWYAGGMPGMPQGTPAATATPTPVTKGGAPAGSYAGLPDKAAPAAAEAAGDPGQQIDALISKPENAWVNDWVDKGTGAGAVPGKLDKADASALISAWVQGSGPQDQQLQPLLQSLPPQMKAEAMQQIQNDWRLGFFPQKKQQLLAWLS